MQCVALLNDKVLTINSAYLHQYNFTKMISLRDVKASTVYYFKKCLHKLCKLAGDVLAFNYTFTYNVSFVINIIVQILSYVTGFV